MSDEDYTEDASGSLQSTRVHVEAERDKSGRFTKPPSNAWKPGQSGNPGGRPALEREIVNLARANTPKAIQTLCEIMVDKKAQSMARVLAANSVVDRGFGKAQQTVNLQTDTAEMTNPVLMAFIAAKFREIALTIETESDLPLLEAPEGQD